MKYVPCIDAQNRTCLEVKRTNSEVHFIPISATGLRVCRQSIQKFEENYQPIPNYPAKKAYKLFLEVALSRGATAESLRYINPNFSKKEKVMSKSNGKERKPTAASRFQGLIMEGELTDAEIFAKVQKEFNLSDNKRSYVSWYRNYLKRQGKNPPSATKKDGPKTAKKAPAKKKPVAKKKAPAKKGPTATKV